MQMFCKFFAVFTAQYLRKKAFVCCLLLLPICTAAVLWAGRPDAQTGTALCAGVYIEAQSQVAQQAPDDAQNGDTQDALEHAQTNATVTADAMQNGNAPKDDVPNANAQPTMAQAAVDALLEQTQVKFIQYTGQEALLQDVKTGKIAVGYIISPDFAQGVANLQVESLVKAVKLKDDVYHRYLNEFVFCAVYQQMVPYLTQDFLRSYGIDTPLDQVSEAVAQHLAEDSLFTVDIVAVDGVLPQADTQESAQASTPTSTQVSAQESTHTNPAPKTDPRTPLLRGVLCIGLLMLTLLGAATHAGNQGGWALFTPYFGKVRGACYALLPVCILGFCAALASLGVAAIWAPGLLALGTEIPRLVVYQAMLFCVGLVLPRLFGRDLIVLLLPFLFLFVLVTHPILFDVTSFFPKLASYLAWLPSYWYLG